MGWRAGARLFSRGLTVDLSLRASPVSAPASSPLQTARKAIFTQTGTKAKGVDVTNTLYKDEGESCDWQTRVSA